VVKATGLSDGERVEIETCDGGIVIRRAVPHFTLEELFQGKSPKQWRASLCRGLRLGAGRWP
jgi:antitoxin component of MazEF toxin-antitoxin module